MRAEVETEIQKPIEYAPMRIARAVLVSPISVSDILDRLRTNTPQDLSFSEVLLIQKSEDSKPSAGQVMAVGGEVDPGETIAQGALREVSEEVTATSLAEASTKLRWDKEPKHNFTFKIGTLNEPRSINLFVLPVQSQSFSVHRPRESNSDSNSEDKIGEVLHFSPQELTELIQKGVIKKDGSVKRAAGHFTTMEDNTIEISELDRVKKEKALDAVIKDVKDFDIELKRSTLLQVNRVRVANRQSRVPDLSECTPEEIARGFVGAQLRLALLDERREELKKGPHQLDSLLKALPYLASKLPSEELPNLLLSIPNSEAKKAVTLLTIGFSKGVQVIVSHFSDKLVEQPPQNGYCSENERLRNVWPDFLKLPLVERDELMKKADKAVVEEIIEGNLNGFIRDDVADAMEVVENWHEYITSELHELHQSLFQEHRPMNEISNRSLFTRMIYTMGFHPHQNVDDQGQVELRVLRFEAVKDLARFFVALEAAKQVRESDISLFQGALDTFFKFPPMKEYINLGRGKFHPVYHRATKEPVLGKELHVMVDEKPKKSALSITRKKFQSPDVNDIFSVNFALADDNFKDSNNPIIDRLVAAKAFREDLLNHVQSELADSGWSVSIMGGTHKRGVIKDVEENCQTGGEVNLFDVRLRGGTRAGSKGDAIIREKFILCIENDEGEKQILEICIYPFERSKSAKVNRLGNAGYWGFAEKLLDDHEGSYKAKRILERDPAHPTMPSFYEREFPRRFYPWQSDKMREEHVKSRKSKIKVVNGDSEMV